MCGAHWSTNAWGRVQVGPPGRERERRVQGRKRFGSGMGQKADWARIKGSFHFFFFYFEFCFLFPFSLGFILKYSTNSKEIIISICITQG